MKSNENSYTLYTTSNLIKYVKLFLKTESGQLPPILKTNLAKNLNLTLNISIMNSATVTLSPDFQEIILIPVNYSKNHGKITSTFSILFLTLKIIFLFQSPGFGISSTNSSTSFISPVAGEELLKVKTKLSKSTLKITILISGTLNLFSIHSKN